jgi:hypothetical protein
MARLSFVVFSEFGEILDVAMHLKRCKHKVVLYIPDPTAKQIGNGMIEKTDEWYRYIGQNYTWIFDSTNYGDLQDWLRERGEAVFGGSRASDDMENNRQKNQAWFRDAGFRQPQSQNFTDLDDAITFVMKNRTRRWIMKQNGDAPKHLSHLGKFKDSVDMLFHLRELQKKWNPFEFGQLDFDLMEVVKGMEVAASVFFNGENFMKNAEGKVVGYLNFEEKKESDGDLGRNDGGNGYDVYRRNRRKSAFQRNTDAAQDR